MADHFAAPPSADYEAEDSLELQNPAQYRALFDDTRMEIIALLSDRAATTSELAETLGKPKGTVGHHLKVLEAAGLIRVVRTQRVRALEAKYYGRTARLFLYSLEHEAVGEEARTLSRAASEIDTTLEGRRMVEPRSLRLTDERARELVIRLRAVVDEYVADPSPRDARRYAVVTALYPTKRRRLPVQNER